MLQFQHRAKFLRFSRQVIYMKPILGGGDPTLPISPIGCVLSNTIIIFRPAKVIKRNTAGLLSGDHLRTVSARGCDSNTMMLANSRLTVVDKCDKALM